jgi:hypothetical protein
LAESTYIDESNEYRIGLNSFLAVIDIPNPLSHVPEALGRGNEANIVYLIDGMAV